MGTTAHLSPQTWRPYSPILLGLLGAACADSPAEIETLQPSLPTVLHMTVDSALGPIFRTLSVGLDIVAPLEVDYWTADSDRLRIASEPASTHHVFLPRLGANRNYDFEIRSVSPSSASGSLFVGGFVTGQLPPEIDNPRLQAIGIPTFPLLMLEIRVPNQPSIPFIVDHQGDIVWYRVGSGSRSAGFTRLANGDFVFLVEDGLEVVTPDQQLIGELANSDNMRIHHDVTVTSDNTVLFLARSDQQLWLGALRSGRQLGPLPSTK